MSGFDDRWLALREPVDARSRDQGLVARLDKWLSRTGESSTPTRAVLDLGAGTGSNFRHLAPRLSGAQRWTLVDHDADLLGRVPDRLAPWAAEADLRLAIGTGDGTGIEDGDGDGVIRITGETLHATIETRQLDLARELDTLAFAEHDLVTASALLDLAGADWLDALAAHCAAGSCAVLFTLSYDGRLRWTPPLPDDDAVAASFNRHQRQDKGLGLSLGPDAAQHVAERLTAHGLDVSIADTPWRLDASDAADAALEDELVDGLARAASEIDAALRPRITTWRDARRATALAGCSCPGHATLLVGHIDVLALPKTGRGG